MILFIERENVTDKRMCSEKADCLNKFLLETVRLLIIITQFIGKVSTTCHFK